MDAAIAALEKKKQPKVDENTPFVIWGMGNQTDSGYSYCIHIPERNGNEMINSPTYDLLSVKVGWEWMEGKRNEGLLSQEEQLKMGKEVLTAAKKLAGIE